MANCNILQRLKLIALETRTSDLQKSCNEVVIGLSNNQLNFQDAVKSLSRYILIFEDARLFRKYLSNILLALVSERIPLKPVFSKPNFKDCNDAEKLLHLECCITLSILSDHPDILQYALKYLQVNLVPPYEVFAHREESYDVALKRRKLQDGEQSISALHVVTACYTYLSKFPNELPTKWEWSKFVTDFHTHKDPSIRWMVKECMTILANMTESQSKHLAVNLHLTQAETLECVINSTSNTFDPYYIEDNDVTKLSYETENVVNINGILLPVYDKGNVLISKLVPVASTVNNLRSLALAVASGMAIGLMGPVGSGKTSLVEHLAEITGRKGIAFKKVQLGEQIDSRMLLGTHHCTDVPGEFKWRPGVLTEAVQNGHWLLLEDIDCAALDVASTLSSLLERNSLSVPGYRDSLPVTPGFQLFVTQRTMVTNYGFQKKMSNASTLLHKHLTQINVEPLSRSELSEIIQELFPTLKTVCPKMIEVFMMFSVGSHDSSLETTHSEKDSSNFSLMRGSRLISTRDLLKWCRRAVIDYKVTSSESALKILQDALDIFTCSISSPEDRLDLSNKIATCLGIVETKSVFYCKHYKPNVSLNTSYMEVGRAKVKRKEKDLESLDFDAKQVVFSFTRPSACLLERIACCVMSNEPVLLVGETGTGKTSSVQYLAKQTGNKLVVINMNQQSDSADLLGGYKPVDIKYVIRPILNEFKALFSSFYNVEKNRKFLHHIDTCYETENWSALVALMKQSYKAAVTRLSNEKKSGILKKWLLFENKLSKLDQQVKIVSRLTFAFIEGSLIKAMQEGHWVLLDEINLASAEILECLAGLLEDKSESIDLLEKGDKVPMQRHKDFTLFACMNPATDVGKKDLPLGLRNRFTEFYIDELTDKNDLIMLIGDYLYHMNINSSILEAIYRFYANIRQEAKRTLVDGAGNTPHYSLRTLCRALTAAAKAKCGTVARSLYESFCLSFLTQLDSSSHPIVETMIAKAVIGKHDKKSVLHQEIPKPQSTNQSYLLFEGHWIPAGKLEIAVPDDYILTPTVNKNLRDIARIISLGRLPVLLQGDTSVGKTSLITYIAKASGNYCVRINNHEHTDLQEYIGSYSTDDNGKLIFKEGVLVEAMRKGYWIILDELNLAPSDVLEALNRVLDDNRELYIAETQTVVKADPNFMLFATQNPPGLYGGRKMLSRAFRNRFVELHFDEIPKKELEIILHKRCHIPQTYAKNMIAVMAELQIRRRGSAAVQGKDGFITLRDLFRWGQRYKLASQQILTTEKFYDWDQHIADEGYLILAGKVRQPDERNIIEDVIHTHIKREVKPENLFSLHDKTSPVTKAILEELLNNQLEEYSHVVWTYNMRRLAVLIAKGFKFNEPILLVGETGCGKTTICQVLAALKKTKLLTVNCHMHTESADFLGSLRPVRQCKKDGPLFEWVDGPLVNAMENGQMFLADEISLADDSVLERLNSLLEPERQIVLSERGTGNGMDIVVVTAKNDFYFVGTMNPGGDFGKKELSPALRNRFTEIWCDSVTSREDLLAVLEKSVNKDISLENQKDGTSGIGKNILDFIDYLKNSEVTEKFPFSIRDLLSWVHFINSTVSRGILNISDAYINGACMIFLDCFGTTLTGHIDTKTLYGLRQQAEAYLLQQMKKCQDQNTDELNVMLNNQKINYVIETDNDKFGIKPFYVEVGTKKINDSQADDKQFTFSSPTTGGNTLRLLRGLQLKKAILLEGNPGVGKTSLVTALAKASGNKVVRINLSDQTDITDLFGTDLPTEDGNFTFKEGAFLTALQNGHWILLDELNLAPQPVLEGLNACLDHRGEVFITELGETFKVSPQTRLFACQNPLKQGGARRGLPVSFLNRFTQVYIDKLTQEDLIFIVESQYPTIPKEVLHKIVKFNCMVSHEISELQSWGHRGSPWEMNLRDIQRWCDALVQDQTCNLQFKPGKFVEILYINRMRSIEDKHKMATIYDELFCPDYPRSDSTPQFGLNDDSLIFGDVVMSRNREKTSHNRRSFESKMVIMRHQLPILKSLAKCVEMNWLSILVGTSATGKSSVIQILADLTGNELHVVPVTLALDISDLLGGFEQVDYNRNIEVLYEQLQDISIQTVRNMWLNKEQLESNKIVKDLYNYKTLPNNTENDLQNFKTKLDYLQKYCTKLLMYNKENEVMLNRLQEVKGNLNKLKLKASTSVNAGGKFEWIDSLLVKTMLEGSWLVLDNVNLTSSAVLDRLNGLLEPNGVLCVSETGENYEVVPHPNFRVFFTMDPKYGEISRAMRNRGVEIFILRPDDFDIPIHESIPYLDLVALLSSCGLPSQYHVLCIYAHEVMSSFVQGFDKPTISHLLQVAHLTCQQIVRGIPYKTSMINSFSDVYIKPRCGGDFASAVITSLAEMKNQMLSQLNKTINNYTLENDTDNTSHTLTVGGLCKNRCYELARRSAYAYVQQASDRDIENSLYSLCTLFITTQNCPNSCLQYFHHTIDKQLKNNVNHSMKKLGRILNNTAYEASDKEDETEMCHRFYPEAFNLNTKDIEEINRKVILLYNKLTKPVNCINSSQTDVSALDYSNAVLSGKLTDDFPEYPILKCCQHFIHKTDAFIQSVFTDKDIVLSDANVCKIIQLLNWRNRFMEICLYPMFVATNRNKTPVLKEEIVTLIYLHSKWLNKHLFQGLLSLLKEKSEVPIKYIQLQDAMFYEKHSNDLIQSLGKKLRKLCGQPKLYRNQAEYDTCKNRSQIYSSVLLDLNQPIAIQKPENKFNIAGMLHYSLALDTPDEAVIEQIDEGINKLTNLPNIIIEEMNSDLKLLPLKTYIILRVLNLLQTQLLRIVNSIKSSDQINSTPIVKCNKFNIDYVKLLNDLVYSIKFTKGFPPKLTNLLELMQQLLDPISRQNLCDRTTSFPAKFWDEYYKILTTSPAQYPLAFANVIPGNNEPTPDDVTEIIPIQTKRFSTTLPLLPNYVKILTDGNYNDSGKLGYELVALKNSAEYSSQLDATLDILWNNIMTLDTAATLKLQSDMDFELKKYEQFICNLHSILKPSKNQVRYSNKLVSELLRILEEKNNNDAYFTELIKQVHNVYVSLTRHIENASKIDTGKLELKILTTKLSLLSSLLFTKVMSEISSIDEIEKHKLKCTYFNKDIEMFEALLGSYYIQGLIAGNITHSENITKASEVSSNYYEEDILKRDNLEKIHPHCSIFLELRQVTIEKVAKYISGNTFRPTEPSYTTFAKDCKHFVKSLLSSESTDMVFKNILNIFDMLVNSWTKGRTLTLIEIEMTRNAIKETSTWLYSVNSFYKKVESQYSEAFSDLVKPLLGSLSQIVYSVTALNDIIKEFWAKIKHGPKLCEIVVDLITFPNKITSHENSESYLTRYMSNDFIKVLNNNLPPSEDYVFDKEMEHLKVLKMNLQELNMYCTTMEEVDETAFNSVLTALNALVNAWDKQEREIQMKKEEDDALYVTKSKCEDINEDEQAEVEISEMFPTFIDTDFDQFKYLTLEKTKPNANIGKQLKLVMTPEDITLVYKWHSAFIRSLTSAEWLKNSDKNSIPNYIEPFLEKYSIFTTIVQNSWEAFDVETEGIISPSLMVIISKMKEKVGGRVPPGHARDFYRSSWVSESKQCIPLLQKVKDNTEKLLKEWPDFPSLVNIMVILNRILSFSITSPVARFLTGLELLRDKIEEWNKNAHKGNNMIDLSLEVGQQIIIWRKLEMSHWRDCIKNLYQRKQAEAHKYWFYLYNVATSYVVVSPDDKQPTKEEIVVLLQNFVEKSNLAEFEVKLDLLYVYHCHLVHLKQSPRRDELLSVLWNTHRYYSQFSDQVSAYIRDKRTPIEKKLRDFVKICTWDRDLSYWNVKDTVEKAQKTLHKHTKEFEKILNESVTSCLVIDQKTKVVKALASGLDRPKRTTSGRSSPMHTICSSYMIDPQNYIVEPRNIKKYLEIARSPSKLTTKSSLLGKIPELLDKAKTLCRATISNTTYSSSVQALDDFVTQVISNSNHLKSLEINTDLSKEKQISQAKQILQQKRKGLADMFRYLSRMGLNYRKGLMLLAASDNDLYDFTLMPVDLDAVLTYLKPKRSDKQLSMFWDGCEDYYQKNIAMHKFLTSALQSPHQDLGVNNMERCKGFSAQLMSITVSQKKKISKYSRYLAILRTLVSTLMSSLDIKCDVTNISRLKEKLQLLSECYGNADIVLQQFKILLNSCPERQTLTECGMNFDASLSDSRIVNCYLNTDEWNVLLDNVSTLIQTVKKQKSALSKVKRSLPMVVGKIHPPIPICTKHVNATIEAKDVLKNVNQQICSLVQIYQYQFKSSTIEGFTPQHPFLRSLTDLSDYIDDILSKINNIDISKQSTSMENTQENVKLFIERVEDLVATALLTIQSLYKKHLPNKDAQNGDDAENPLHENNEEASNDIFKENCLRDNLEDELSSDLKLLKVENVINKTYPLLNQYLELLDSDVTDIKEIKDELMRIYPILGQIALFVQYFLTQQVAAHRVSCKMLSILLSIFTDLTTKGFCKPSDLDVEAGDGEGVSNNASGGMGLGDGEGKKDVSDRIENQDQLDDARRPGDEKEQEDKDCKEEEKGVNMTDDFDSRLQDVEKQDGENSDEDDDNDVDKQMGETEKASDKLDQQIWGTEEDENDEGEQKDQEEKGTGESTGEKEMAAKEQEQGVDDDSKGKDKQKKKDINEMQEPEVDDDHVDPYHGNLQPLPEPEDFDLPQNMNLDGEQAGDEQDGETETENPFDIDVMKDNMTEEKETEDGEKEKDNEQLQMSSDDEPEETDKETEKDANEQKDDQTDDDGNGDVEQDKMDTDPAPDEPKPNDDPEDLLKNPDPIEEQDEIEEKKRDANPNADPSNDDPSKGERAENAEVEKGTDDNVQTNPDQIKDEDAAPFEQLQEQVGDEKQATGRAELDKSDKGHRGQKQTAKKARDLPPKERPNTRSQNKPGRTEEERTLAEANNRKRKANRTLNVEKEDNASEEGGEQKAEQETDADAYQHVKQARKDDQQAVDAATKEQADQQPMILDDDEQAEEVKADDELAMEADVELQVDKSENELLPEKSEESTKREQDKDKSGANKDSGDPTGESTIDVEGEIVATEVVPRGNDTTYHTSTEALTVSIVGEELSVEQYMNVREWLAGGGARSAGAGGSAADAWRSLWARTGGQARALTETLRLILEPTGRSRLAGDFRTGRRINMRRVIPYVASQFRRDRIWLRRTRPARREYKIAIALDDSSSMSDNKSMELAFESLALVTQALNLLESGDIAVLSYGTKPRLLHPFSEQFSEHSGAKILENLRFDQTKTNIAQLLDFASVMFDEQTAKSDAVNAKLLVIVGDGQGIYSEGATLVRQAVRRARQSGIFLVYVIADHANRKYSIIDIQKPITLSATGKGAEKGLIGFTSYLDSFPFPFYLILRDLSALPTVLGDALRQWFELAANTSS